MAEIEQIFDSGEAKKVKEVGESIKYTDTQLLKLTEDTMKLVSTMKEAGLSFDKFKKTQKETEESTKKLDAVGKQLEQTEKKISQLEDKRQTQLLKNRAEIQKQTKSIKDLNRAKIAERGSTEQLAAVNVILEKRLRSVNQTTAEGRKRADLLRSAIDKNNKKITEQSSAFVKTKRGIGGYSEGVQDAINKSGILSREMAIVNKITVVLTSLTNKQAQAQAAATTATTMTSKALKVLKVALISTGIGAIVVALGSLVAFFKSSEEGAAALQRVMSPFKILFGNLKDIVIKLGESLFNAFQNPREAVSGLWEVIKKNLLNRVTGIIDTFKFLGKTIKAALDLDWDAVKENAAKAGESMIQTMTGIDDAIGKATKAVTGFIDENKKENEQNKRLINERLALIKRERTASVELAKLEVSIQQNRLKLKDEENLTDKERLVFAEKAQEQINQQAKIQEELASKRLAFRKLENSFSTSSQEDLDEEARLQVELINVQANNSKKLLRIESEKQTIIKKTQKIQEDAVNAQMQIETDAKNEMLEIDKMVADEEQELFEESDERARQEFERDEKRLERKRKQADEEQRIEQEKANNIVNTATSLGEALGALASGQIKSFKDFSKEILLIALDVLEKQILLVQAEILAKDIASKGFLGVATAGAKFVLIKAAFAGVKGAIAAFAEGTENAPSEFIAGEAGRELIHLNTGQLVMADSATHFKGNQFKGATVYTNQETEKIIQGANTRNNINFDTTELRNSMNRVEKAIRNKPTLIMDKDYRTIGQQKNNHREIYINRLRYGK